MPPRQALLTQVNKSLSSIKQWKCIYLCIIYIYLPLLSLYGVEEFVLLYAKNQGNHYACLLHIIYVMLDCLARVQICKSMKQGETQVFNHDLSAL